ncbi:hypothetical protein D3C85_1177240 [compost metagenome]
MIIPFFHLLLRIVLLRINQIISRSRGLLFLRCILALRTVNNSWHIRCWNIFCVILRFNIAAGILRRIGIFQQFDIFRGNFPNQYIPFQSGSLNRKMNFCGAVLLDVDIVRIEYQIPQADIAIDIFNLYGFRDIRHSIVDLEENIIGFG